MEFPTVDALARLNAETLRITHDLTDLPHVAIPDRPGFEMALRKLQDEFREDPPLAAAALCYVILALHPFGEGNHRTSCWAGKMLLMMNGWSFSARDPDDQTFYEERRRLEREHQLTHQWDVLDPLVPASSRFAQQVRRGLEGPYGRLLKEYYRTFATR